MGRQLLGVPRKVIPAPSSNLGTSQPSPSVLTLNIVWLRGILTAGSTRVLEVSIAAGRLSRDRLYVGQMQSVSISRDDCPVVVSRLRSFQSPTGLLGIDEDRWQHATVGIVVPGPTPASIWKVRQGPADGPTCTSQRKRQLRRSKR